MINNAKNSDIVSGVGSDHSVVSLQLLCNESIRGKGYWKCNTMLLKHDSEFGLFIKEKIKEFKENHKESDCNPNIIWDAFKCTIRGYCIEYSARKKRQKYKVKKEVLDKIEHVKKRISDIIITHGNEAQDQLADLTKELSNYENIIKEMEDKETAGLIVRSRVRWVEEGERSTKYFCNLEKRVGEKKVIRQLRLQNNKIIGQKDEILSELHNFYSLLYTSENDQNSLEKMSEFFNNMDIPQIAETDKIKLNAPVIKSEILATLKAMSSNKTPGLDGLPVEFYIVFFNDIIDLLLDMYNFSFTNSLLPQSLRHGVITLLPKKDKDSFLVKNYRPISLLNVDYKIIAKLFANRLKLSLHTIIKEDQQGFMPGRNISANIRSIVDMIEYTDIMKIPGTILLLDFEKAFDRVEHNFSIEVLKKFNLGNNFVQWIKTFYNERTSFVMNNGFFTEQISMSRGIFQGCPISPLLFIIAIEVLGIAIRSSEYIKGIPVGNYEKS